MTVLDLRTDSSTSTTTTITERHLLDVHAPSTRRRSAPRIADVSAIVDGTTVRLRYTTDAPLVEILITPYRPSLVDGVWVEWVMDGVDAADHAAGGGTVDVVHRDLRPGLEYHYIITAPAQGDELPAQAIGTFRTPLPTAGASGRGPSRLPGTSTPGTRGSLRPGR